jgi:hypothetical protein
MSESQNRTEQDFDRLLAAYRDACGEPDIPADFMPRLWNRIESGQHWTKQLWKWSNGFVAAAAAASLFFVMLQMLPKRPAVVYTATYLEALADAHDNAQMLGGVAVVPVGTESGRSQEPPVK